MDQELILDGKKYISSKRLAEETGYAGDYISRLCRDGKVEGKLVGRNWYVNLESLTNHQKEAYEKKKEYPQLKRQVQKENPLNVPATEPSRISDTSDISLNYKDLWDSYIMSPAKEVIEQGKELLPSSDEVHVPVSLVKRYEEPENDHKNVTDEDEQAESAAEPVREGISALTARKIMHKESDHGKALQYEFREPNPLGLYYRFGVFALVLFFVAGGVFFARKEIVNAVFSFSEETMHIDNTGSVSNAAD